MRALLPPRSHADLILRGLYAPWLRIWLRFLPWQSILLLSYAELQTNPDAVLQATFHFLRIPGLSLPGPQRRVGFRQPAPLSAEAAAQVRAAAATAAATVLTAPPVSRMDPGIRKELQALYRPYNVELAELTGDPNVLAWNL